MKFGVREGNGDLHVPADDPSEPGRPGANFSSNGDDALETQGRATARCDAVLAGDDSGGRVGWLLDGRLQAARPFDEDNHKGRAGQGKAREGSRRLRQDKSQHDRGEERACGRPMVIAEGG